MIWLFIISKSERRFVLLKLILNTPTPTPACLLLCPGCAPGVGVCNDEGDQQPRAALQMFLRNPGLQGPR